MQASLALKSASVRGGRRQAAPTSRRTVVVPRAGLLDFFKPAPAAASKQNNSQRAKELVEELLQVAGPTQAGDKASGAVRQQVAELVDELEQYCPRAPLRSPLLWGDYEVVYAARPGTIGGPFKSPVGRAVFPGLEASQTLQPPNVCINRVEYKTLGFIPGTSSQEGYFEPVDGNTFKLIFPQQDGKKSGGPRERLITISYLDEKIRVARFTPAEGDDASEPTFYVFTRKEEKPKPEPKAAPAPKAAAKPRGRAAAVEEEEEEQAPAPKARGAFGTQLLRGAPKEGLATRVERSYYRNKGQEGTQEARGGTGTTRRAAGTGTTRRAASAPPAGTQARGTAVRGRGTAAKEAAAPARPMTAQERAEAQKAALREREEARKAAAEARAQQLAEQREARERAAAEQRAARERAEAERKAAQERQAAERKAAAERAAAVRAQLAELTKEASEAQSEAQAAVKTLKDAEKELTPVLRAAAGAKSALEEAIAGAVAAAAAVGELKGEEKEAVRQVDVARKLVSKLESLGRSSK